MAHSSAPESREDRLLATLERLERRVEHMEGALGRLDGATAQVPAVVATLASRTGVAIGKQAPVLVDNLRAHRAGTPLAARRGCPIEHELHRVDLEDDVSYVDVLRTVAQAA